MAANKFPKIEAEFEMAAHECPHVAAAASKLWAMMESSRTKKSAVVYAACCRTLLDSKDPFLATHPQESHIPLRTWLKTKRVKSRAHLETLLQDRLTLEGTTVSALKFARDHSAVQLGDLISNLRKRLSIAIRERDTALNELAALRRNASNN